MKIARNETFGGPSVVQVVEVPTPKVTEKQVLIRVAAASVSTGDWRLRSREVPRGFGTIMGLLFGFKRPKYRCLGTDAAGVVVAQGDLVTRFQVGDRVVASLGMKLGGHAEYVALPETAPISKIPEGLTFEVAAAMVFGGTTALGFLRDQLKLRKNERVLVIGAGGAVGSAAVQIAKAYGAHVTGVCSGGKASLVESLGADEVMDYEKRDWRESTARYDIVLDTVGGVTHANTKHVLTEHGRIGLVIADLPLTLKSAWVSLFHRQKVFAGSITVRTTDLDELLSLCQRGAFMPVIGASFPLEQVVQAHECVESGHKTGNVILKME